MSDFNAFLMPFSFLRRWSYNELIPALLYFDRVTFLMDDIEAQYISDEYRQPGAPPVRLRSPNELAGMNANEFVDGLTVEQHRYYWPMRDLIKEEVIVISSADMEPIDVPNEVFDLVAAEDAQAHRSPTFAPRKREADPRLFLRTELDSGNEHAREYENYANLFYDTIMTTRPPMLDSFKKAMKVRTWIKHALLFQRPGWQHVTLHPHGYRALLSAVKVFRDINELFIRTPADRSGRVSQPPEQSYLAMRVVGTLLQEKLNSFALEGDPNALSEILQVRDKYAANLKAFRAKMAEATNEWRLDDADLRYVPGKVEGYIQKVLPEFEDTRRALSEKLRIPKLVFKKSGAVICIGACAAIGVAIGTTLAGPLGAISGAKAGAVAGGMVATAAPEAFKSIFAELGREFAGKVKPKEVSIDKSLVYLFHAEKALR